MMSSGLLSRCSVIHHRFATSVSSDLLLRGRRQARLVMTRATRPPREEIRFDKLHVRERAESAPRSIEHLWCSVEGRHAASGSDETFGPNARPTGKFENIARRLEGFDRCKLLALLM